MRRPRQFKNLVLLSGDQGKAESDIVSLPNGGKKERGSGVVSGATGRPAEVLRERGGVKVVGTAGSSAHISKDACNLTQGKDLPSLIYHEPAPEVRFVRGTAGRTSFLTIRVHETIPVVNYKQLITSQKLD